MLASDILDRVYDVLQDDDQTRWAETELLRWITAAQRAVANARPQSVATTAVVTLAAGVSQAVPSGGFLLLDVTQNMGVDGATPGRPIRKVDWATLKAFATTWASADDGAVVKNYAYDPERDKLNYEVFPRIPSSPVVQVEIIYAKTPVEVDDAGDTLAVLDDYENPLVDFVLFRAFSKESEVTDAARATGHYNSFAAALGLKQVGTTAAPRTRSDNG